MIAILVMGRERGHIPFERVELLADGAVSASETRAPAEPLPSKDLVFDYKIVIEGNDRHAVTESCGLSQKATHRATPMGVVAQPVRRLPQESRVQVDEVCVSTSQFVVRGRLLKVEIEVLKKSSIRRPSVRAGFGS